jgi:hypothetical protein
MNYLEVKLEAMEEKEINTSTFISDIINQQETLGTKENTNSFNNEKLLSLGFNHNKSTNGFTLKKDFTFNELFSLAKEINKINNHLLIHGFLVLKVYQNELYFWDTSLIYEGVDTFEYCLKYHNIFKLGKVNVVSNSECINEALLILAEHTRRYSEPDLNFITNASMWDKKEGVKILTTSIPNINEFIAIKDVIPY